MAKHELIELVRTTQERVAKTDPALVEGIGKVGTLYPIKIGREKVEQQIFENAASKLEGFGIELLDVRFKRINYNETVRRRIYERMVSERQQIADRFRSEGAAEAAKISGTKEKDLQQIESEAYNGPRDLRGSRCQSFYLCPLTIKQGFGQFYAFIKTLKLTVRS